MGRKQTSMNEETQSPCKDVNPGQNSGKLFLKTETKKLILKRIWKNNTIRIGKTMCIRMKWEY